MYGKMLDLSFSWASLVSGYSNLVSHVTWALNRQDINILSWLYFWNSFLSYEETQVLGWSYECTTVCVLWKFMWWKWSFHCVYNLIRKVLQCNLFFHFQRRKKTENLWLEPVAWGNFIDFWMSNAEKNFHGTFKVSWNPKSDNSLSSALSWLIFMGLESASLVMLWGKFPYWWAALECILL